MHLKGQSYEIFDLGFFPSNCSFSATGWNLLQMDFNFFANRDGNTIKHFFFFIFQTYLFQTPPDLPNLPTGTTVYVHLLL